MPPRIHHVASLLQTLPFSSSLYLGRYTVSFMQLLRHLFWFRIPAVGPSPANPSPSGGNLPIPKILPLWVKNRYVRCLLIDCFWMYLIDFLLARQTHPLLRAKWVFSAAIFAVPMYRKFRTLEGKQGLYVHRFVKSFPTIPSMHIHFLIATYFRGSR